jgi:hypothetical protein
LLESCVETRLSPENFVPTDGCELTIVTNGNFAEFAALHDNANPAMYWTSERIIRDLSQWCMYMYKSNYILMRLTNDEAEIYAIKASEKYIGETLVSAASKCAFKIGKPYILYMIDENAPGELEIAQTVGFTGCGKYVAYQTVIQ